MSCAESRGTDCESMPNLTGICQCLRGDFCRERHRRCNYANDAAPRPERCRFKLQRQRADIDRLAVRAERETLAPAWTHTEAEYDDDGATRAGRADHLPQHAAKRIDTAGVSA